MQPQSMVMHAELPQAVWHSDLQEASQHSTLRNDRCTSDKGKWDGKIQLSSTAFLDTILTQSDTKLSKIDFNQ